MKKKKQNSSILIDDLINSKFTYYNIYENKYYEGYAKRPTKYSGKKWRSMNFCKRLKACWRILNDKSLAMHFKEDE